MRNPLWACKPPGMAFHDIIGGRDCMDSAIELLPCVRHEFFVLTYLTTEFEGCLICALESGKVFQHMHLLFKKLIGFRVVRDVPILDDGITPAKLGNTKIMLFIAAPS